MCLRSKGALTGRKSKCAIITNIESTRLTVFYDYDLFNFHQSNTPEEF